MTKLKKSFVLLDARFSLTPEENIEFQKILTESNRTIDNLVETLLKLVISRRNEGGMFIDCSDIGIRYKPKPVPKQKPVKSHE